MHARTCTRTSRHLFSPHKHPSFRRIAPPLFAITHIQESKPPPPPNPLPAHSLRRTLTLLPKWCVWDSDGDSHNNISTCCGTQERHREAAADAALTAPGLPRPAQTPSRPLLPRYTQAGRKHSAGPLFTQDPSSPTLGLQTTQQQGRVQDRREQREG